MSAISEYFAGLADGPVWITGKFLKGFAALLEKDRPRLMGGCGDEVATSKGRFFNVRGGGTGPASAASPVMVRVTSLGWKAGVVNECRIYQPIEAGMKPAELIIGGKLTSSDPTDSDPGWVDVAAGDSVCVEGTVAALVAVSAAVAVGAEFSGGEIENNGSGDQSKFRLYLADIVADGDSLIAVPTAGMIHRLGITLTDSVDSAGGNKATITAVMPFGH